MSKNTLSFVKPLEKEGVATSRRCASRAARTIGHVDVVSLPVEVKSLRSAYSDKIDDAIGKELRSCAKQENPVAFAPNRSSVAEIDEFGTEFEAKSQAEVSRCNKGAKEAQLAENALQAEIEDRCAENGIEAEAYQASDPVMTFAYVLLFVLGEALLTSLMIQDVAPTRGEALLISVCPTLLSALLILFST